MTDPHGSFDGWVKMAEYLQRTLDGAPDHVKKLVLITDRLDEKSSRLEALRVSSVELEKALGFKGESRVFLPDFTGIDPFDWKKSAYFSPLMCEDGGIPTGYAHFISGLMLNKIIPRMAHRDVMFSVLCLGRGLLVDAERREWINNTRVNEDHEKLDGICGDIFQNLIESAAFRDVIKKPSAGTKHVHRTVLWLSRNSHAFAIGWEVSSDGYGTVFVLDCMPPDKFIHKLVDVFTLGLERVYLETVGFEVCFDALPYSLTGTSDVPTAPDFVCVPFMARSTLYISIMPSLFRDVDFSGFVKHIGIDLERRLYAHFEYMLLDFIDMRFKKKQCLRFSESFHNETILNINNIWFDVVSKSGEAENTAKFFFDGFNKGFVECRVHSEGDESCFLQMNNRDDRESTASSLTEGSGVQEIEQADYDKAVKMLNPDLFLKWEAYIRNTRTLCSADGAFFRNISESSAYYSEIYLELLIKSAANNMKWIGKFVTVGQTLTGNLEYGMIKTGGTVHGYDFLVGTPSTIPCMSSAGGFSPRYGHVLPALMLARFLMRSSAIKVKTVHICQGYGVPSTDRWWDNSAYTDYGKVADLLIRSTAFVTGVKSLKDCETHKIKRMCIWLSCVRHVFFVVWEWGAGHDVLFYVDNHGDNAFRKGFMPVFSEKLMSGGYRADKHFDCFAVSNFSSSGVKLTPHLMCVSYMARCTAYLNSIDSFLDDSFKAVINHIVTTVDAQICYLKFEEALFAFITNQIKNGLCVWLPGLMDASFVNINDICLNVIDPTSGEVNSFVYEGVGYQFQKIPEAAAPNSSMMCIDHGNNDAIDVCSIQSRFQCLNPRPTHLSTLPLRSAVSLLKECRELLSHTSSTIRSMRGSI
jgi:hypothetical protein